MPIAATALRRVRRALPSVAGPALILAAVLIVLHDFAFGGRFAIGHDLEGYFWPNYCFLGRSLTEGVLPGWNPFVMSGLPFAADPQSGWLYLPAMAVFSALPCDAALPFFLVLLPVVAGLGLYWFLRIEGLSRTAATTGGLMLSVGIAASRTVITPPFSGALAWTALLLALTARYLHSDSWPGRLVWLVLAALAWGTLAAAHPSQGLAFGTIAFIVYVAARIAGLVRRRRALEGAALGLLLVGALILVNLAFLLPRAAYLSDTSLSLGYDALRESGASIAASNTTGASWPLRLATWPGTYLAAIPLALSFAGGWLRERLALVIAFATFGAICYVIGLDAVVHALEPTIGQLPLADVYVHGAARFAYGLLLSIAVLSAVGIDAWRRASGLVPRLLMLVPGVVVWGILPLVLGVDRGRLLGLAVGAAIAAVVLVAVALRPALVAVIAIVVAVELSVEGIAGQQQKPAKPPEQDLGRGWAKPFVNFPEPSVVASDYLRVGPVARAMREGGLGRYISLPDLGVEEVPGGEYLFPWKARDAGLLNAQRAIFFELEDVQGYNPALPLRYWRFVHRVNERTVRYNQARFLEPTDHLLDLLNVRWVIGPVDSGPPPGLIPIVEERRWVLYARPAPPRAELITAWTIEGPSAALDAVSSPSFDSTERVILETPPGVPPPPAGEDPGSAVYRPVGTQGARIEVEAAVPTVLLIRNPWSEHWDAELDGRPAQLLHADYLLQAVVVPEGRHVVDLVYRDPTIGLGLAGSGSTIGLILIAALALRLRERRRRGGPEASNAARPGADDQAEESPVAR